MSTDNNHKKGDTNGPFQEVINKTFVRKLAHAMCTFWIYKYFSTDRRTSISWTFFGIAENTVPVIQIRDGV
ncbi:hypothetical protein EYZ11_002444 [Aspergillus tanneri]|uniref:Uncharacterized protein n=1 Tax=Aspergillus tanneri TaxID=1220188 RepID=A0A4S3JQX4_9EURO|nr:hypothetical protein EYZ11_002444 [Aspergillus tanneri]